MIYLDHAATTPMSRQAIEMYSRVAEAYFGNANSLHDAGSSAKQIKEASIRTIAGTLGARAIDLYMTSGATEANFLAIMALLDGTGYQTGHIITSQIEHSSVRNVFLKLQKKGFEVTWLCPAETGIIEPQALKEALREDTRLVSIQLINSEIGTIQPVSEIAQVLREKGILFHTDAVQAFGKIPVDVNETGVDALTISAHKVYGPKNAGAVWFRPGTPWVPFLEEVTQKKKLRGGTDDVAGMAAFAAAAKETTAAMPEEYGRIKALKTAFIEGLQRLDHAFVVEGDQENSSPYILGIRFPGMEGQFLMLECSQAGLAISTGSACQAGSELPNRTMKSLGRTDEEARQFVRFSFGKLTDRTQLDEIIDKLDTILTRHFNKVHR